MGDISTVVFKELRIPDKPYTEEEASVIATELFSVLDVVSSRRSDPAAKTALVDFIGTANSGKTKTTENIERFFRRHRFNVLCPPETAEIPEVRNRSTDNILIFQARHVAGVQNYVLNLGYNRDYHLAIISRGLIDMLYWYERWVREGRCSELHRQSVKNAIYELLRLDIMDAIFFLTCSADEAMRREYGNSITKRRGSNTNEQTLAEAQEIYGKVLADVEQNVPSLPLFSIDTTHLDPKETAEEVLRHLLPTLCARFRVPGSRVFSKSLSLLKKEAFRDHSVEEQLKLRGHVSEKKLARFGWTEWATFGSVEQDDFYLDTALAGASGNAAFGENVRLRKQGDAWLLYFKSSAEHQIFSHRHPLLVKVAPEDAKQILQSYPVTQRIKKLRKHFRLEKDAAADIVFVLHLDTIEELGKFTEIRTISSAGTTHTTELFALATELGFKPCDIVEGSYLALATSSPKAADDASSK